MRIGEVTNKKDLIQAVERLRKERLENRRPFEEVWWNNIALVAGDHYASYDAQQAGFVEVPKERHQIRLVLNQARVVLRTEIAKLMKAKPIMEVVPNSNDEKDIAAAKVGKFALDAAEWKFDLRRKRKRALWWTGITGCASIYVGYDPANTDDGFFEVTLDPNTNEPVWDPRRKAEIQRMVDEGDIDEQEPEQWALGDLEFRLYTPFHMLPDDTVFDFDECKDIIVTDVVELEVAKDTWKESASDITPEAGRPSFMNRMLRRAGLSTSDSNQYASEDTVLVHTYWLKPGIYDSPFLRDGIMIRWTGHEVELEYHDGFPFDDARLPFAFFRHTENAVAIWPDTVMTDIRDVNLELDKTISLLLENRDYMTSPMWRKAKQHQVAKIKMQPGGEVEYVHVRDVPPPEPIPGTPMPTQVENLVVGLRDQILDISGQGEVSRGRLPAGVRSGVQMTYLQEEDETRLGPVADEWEATISTMASLILSRMGQFYSIPRLMKNYRPGGQADVRKFKGADLKGNTDVQVQTGTGLPKLKAARQQFAINMAELGIETDPKRLRDILELGEGEPDEIDLAFSQADRENEEMRGQAMIGGQMTMQPDVAAIPGANGGGMPGGVPVPGGPPPEPPMGMNPMFGPSPEEQMSQTGPQAVPVKKWHNHAAHKKRHYRYMSTVEFERLARTRPEIVRIFDEHTAMHEQAEQALQMQQMQMMMAARGGPEATAPPEGAQPVDQTQAAEVQKRRAT